MNQNMAEIKREELEASQFRKSSGRSDITIDANLERKFAEFEERSRLFGAYFGQSSTAQPLNILPQNTENNSTLESRQIYVCDICHHNFSQSSNLKRHMLLHSGEKPFSCADCNKSFTTASNLKIHYETHKKRDIRNRHSCKNCSKSFLYKCSLTKHEKKYCKKAENKATESLETTHKLVKKEDSDVNNTQQGLQKFAVPTISNNLYQTSLMQQMMMLQLFNQALFASKATIPVNPLLGLSFMSNQ